MEKQNPFSYLCYRVIRWLVWAFYPKMTVEGAENLPEEPCIVVGNHTKMNGPICAELYFPGKRKTWCAYQMMYLKEVPAYAFQDFWSGKPKWTHWFYKLLSYIIAPISACVFNNANTIPVFYDNRLLTTFKQTVAQLQDGANIIIFPECYDPHNHIVNRFRDQFINIAKTYYKRTGKALSFAPLYIAPSLKKLCIGKPIVFDPENPIDDERQRIITYLMDAVTELAVNLPRHRVVPYPNIPKKDYPYNIQEEKTDEKTGD